MIIFIRTILILTTIAFGIFMGLALFIELLTIFENVKERFKR